MDREITFAQALNEALDLSLAADPAVYVMGLGVPDPKGVFGTTLGLQEKYGATRVMDMPCSENAMTGVAIGSALAGMRPVLTHQRVDFAVLGMEQLVNQAANWSYMFGGQSGVPLVIRMVIGRGWGQGPQHSQSLQAWFAHVPGLKVVMPTTPHDAKGLMISSIEDNNPVVFLEHRWLHNITGHVPEGLYRVPIGEARIVRQGDDVTLVGVSYMALEALRAAERLEAEGISAEVVDVRSLKPLDDLRIVESVRKTGHLVVADTGWASGGVAGEIIARVTEQAFGSLSNAPRRVTLPDCPTPTAPALARHYYPRALHIASAARAVLGREPLEAEMLMDTTLPLDVPDPTFTGPF